MMFMLIASDSKKSKSISGLPAASITQNSAATAGLLPISQGSSVAAASSEARSVVPVSVTPGPEATVVPEATGSETAVVNESTSD